MSPASPLPLVPVAGLDPAIRVRLGAVATLAAPVLILAGPLVAGLACACVGFLALAPRTLSTGHEGEHADARWTPVTTVELDRLDALGLARWRWRRDPWHAASAPGVATLVVALLACALAGTAGPLLAGALGVAPGELAARLVLAAGVALLPPLCAGRRTTRDPVGLWHDVRRVADLCAGAAAQPDPVARLEPELRLARAGVDDAVPVGVRVRVGFAGAPPFLRALRLEPGARGFVPVLTLAADPAVQRALATRPDVALAAGPGGLDVRLAPGPDALARSLALVAALAAGTPRTLSPA